jgi:hypothetical protein
MFSPRVFFRIIYGTFYFFLCLVLFILLLVIPGDSIYQAKNNKQDYNIWIIAVCYLLTVAVVLFVYALRLYINKTVLASIPKSWVPIDKGDVHNDVYKMVVASLNRSAAIAFEARPRVDTLVAGGIGKDRVEDSQEENARQRNNSQLLRSSKSGTAEDESGITLPPHQPVWGEIEHFGWASPNSPDLPNLQYSTVFSELPHLIEAKALTLAPPDPMSEADPPMLDADAVGLLQRPTSMALRDYLHHLTGLGVLAMDATVTNFVTKYEYARFSTQQISNARFREIMHLFADILRVMEPLDPGVLDSLHGDEDAVASESDIDNDAPLGTDPTTPRSGLSRSGTASSHGSRVRPPLPARNESANTRYQYRTAPTTPKSMRTAALSHSSSMSSFAQTRHPYPISQASSSSLRSKASEGAGSVIRLATRTDSSDLPYVLTLTETI